MVKIMVFAKIVLYFTIVRLKYEFLTTTPSFGHPSLKGWELKAIQFSILIPL